jgi:hypothetical protein
MSFLVLEGSARERGRIHGESLRVEIQEMVDGLGEWARSVGADPADYAARIVRETGFLDAAERWVPHVVEEIRGIAEGSGIDFETIFVWNLNDEAEWYLSKDRWVNSEYRELHAAACSAPPARTATRRSLPKTPMSDPTSTVLRPCSTSSTTTPNSRSSCSPCRARPGSGG